MCDCLLVPAAHGDHEGKRDTPWIRTARECNLELSILSFLDVMITDEWLPREGRCGSEQARPTKNGSCH